MLAFGGLSPGRLRPRRRVRWGPPPKAIITGTSRKNPKGYTTETVPNISGTTTLPKQSTPMATPVAAPAAPSSACTANLQPGDDLAIEVSDAPPGTVFCLAAGTYHLLQTVMPKSGDTFIGDAADRPLIDASQTTVGFDGHTTSGVTYENLLIEDAHLNGSKSQCSAYCGRGIWGGNALRVFNVGFSGNQQAGIAGSEGTTTPMADRRQPVRRQREPSPRSAISSGGIKGSNAYTILNSYVADNVGSGIWCDVGCLGGTWTVEGNAVGDNTAGGIRYEISDAGALTSVTTWSRGTMSPGRGGSAGSRSPLRGNAVVENNTRHWQRLRGDPRRRRTAADYSDGDQRSSSRTIDIAGVGRPRMRSNGRDLPEQQPDRR